MAKEKKGKKVTNFQKNVLEHTSAILAIKNLDGCYTYINKEFLRAFSKPEDFFLGKEDKDIDIFKEKKDLENYKKTDLEVIKKGKQVTSKVDLNVNSQTRTFIITKYPIFNKNAQVETTGLVGIDITEITLKEKSNTLLSIQDPLTGSNSYNEFFRLVPKEIRTALRYEYPLSLIVLEIDYFKKINEKHGYKIGDQVLKELTNCCQRIIREHDILSRIGTKKFTIVLLHSFQEKALAMAQRIQDAISQIKITKDLKFEVSVGISEVDTEKANNVESLLKQAETALYTAKHSGKNCIKVYSSLIQKM